MDHPNRRRHRPLLRQRSARDGHLHQHDSEICYRAQPPRHTNDLSRRGAARLASPGRQFSPGIALAGTWDVDLVQDVLLSPLRGAVARRSSSPGARSRFGTRAALGQRRNLRRRPIPGLAHGRCRRQRLSGTGPNVDNQHVIATLKHFAAHGQPEGGTNIAPGNSRRESCANSSFTRFRSPSPKRRDERYAVI